MKKNKILVTGASGFIGTHLIDELRKKNINFIGTSHSKSKEFYEINLSKDTKWGNLLNNCDTIIHLAGLAHKKYSKEDLIKINFEGSVKLIKEAIKSNVKKFIFVSSVAVIQDKSSPYGRVKSMIEYELVKYSKISEMSYVIIRPPLIYGNNAPGNFDLLVKIISIFPILPLGSLDNTMSIIGIRNFIEFILFVTHNSKANNNIFLVSDLENITVTSFIKKIASAKDKYIILISLNKSVLSFFSSIFGLKKKFERITNTKSIDSSETYKYLKWYPKYSTEDELDQLKFSIKKN